jgi:RND family efflux transporter MFP subunit
VLATIDAGGVTEQAISARGGVRTAELAYGDAQRNLERAQRLSQAGAIADRDLEQARTAASAARAQLDDARARNALATRQVGNTQVRAPFSGVVATRTASAGDVVAPGAPLFTVVDPSSMKLEASIPAEQLALARVGAPVIFTVNGYPGKTFTGKVSRVAPVADPTTRQVQVIATIPNSGGNLVGGLFAEGRIAAESRAAITVPTAAVDQRGLAPTVVRVKGGRVQKVTVQLGLRDDASEQIQVVQGLAAGDTLLLGTAQGITPGTPIRVSAPNDVKK